ncbi:MAG: DUF3990 domain-containing protein [Eubacteriales bacterium]|nr:DUF3990 domain-containing protein [Eubacteriales bacterium]
MPEKRIVYHGSQIKVPYPEIRLGKFTKDFSYGFYTTEKKEQAVRWATRFGKPGIVNEYEYTENPELNVLKFEKMTEEWLDFIISCRHGELHKYDIVEGPMADDTIFNYVQNVMDGKISRAAFWELARFKYPTHQLSFHTLAALQTLKFERSYTVNGKQK